MFTLGEWLLATDETFLALLMFYALTAPPTFYGCMSLSMTLSLIFVSLNSLSSSSQN
jgi:hypothetical protein